jgi:cytochrome c-type biogenesis protein CcmE
VSLGVVMVLTTFMLYTAFAGQDVREPILQATELITHRTTAMKQDVQVDGVAVGPVTHSGNSMTFFVGGSDEGKSDSDLAAAADKQVLVKYSGSVPDAFRVGRHVLVVGRLVATADGYQFVANKDSLVTKCPSKFESTGGSGRSGS